MIICYTIPEIQCVTDVIIFILGHFLPFYSLTAKNIKMKKKIKKKTPGDIIILHKCTKNYDQMMYHSWDMLCDRQTDGQTEKVTYRGGCLT